MNPQRKLTRKEVERILDVWIDRLNLGSWGIELDWSHPVEDENDAEICIPKDYDVAKIAIEDSWPTWNQVKVNEVIVHELLHVHFHHLQNAGLSCADFMGREARNLYHGRFIHELEKTVDSLAMATVLGMGPA